MPISSRKKWKIRIRNFKAVYKAIAAKLAKTSKQKKNKKIIEISIGSDTNEKEYLIL
jgi:hypothetical protein